jgi:hypothetical protein
MANEEKNRLLAARVEGVPWRKWGPYLSERQWGTVREDESKGGDAWNYLSHDAARARAYHWGEDGLAGCSDDKQLLCLALALWNERDPILKERLFGLTNSQGNHGEDVKEYYFYLDSTPTHSYMRYLYKYPQRAYPYQELIDRNRRSRQELEFELMDTGIFEDDRYFDVFVEYAKASPEDLLCEITIHNRGPEAAPIHVLPTLWYRNLWPAEGPRPSLWVGEGRGDVSIVAARHPSLGERFLYAAPGAELLFTDNETNVFRFPEFKTNARYYKDAFHYYVVDGNREAVNPERWGTKAAAHQSLTIPPKSSARLRVRLTDVPPSGFDHDPLGEGFSHVVGARRAEADAFYAAEIPANLSPDQKQVVREALGGMFWSKQFYDYDVTAWLTERGVDPYSEGSGRASSLRNVDWHHMVNGDVISMPDKWEYPWYAAWDLAFHTLPLGMTDPDLAKQQLLLLLQERYLHPNGQVPAYEWNFSDVNPPVHAWATYFLYQLDARHTGKPDVAFLKSAFHKLLLNFTWWVNRKDPNGRNVFEGGFLGLDNIGVFDRSAPLPTGGYLEQADGTAWMAFYAQMMLQIAVELGLRDPTYAEMGLKFFEHFVWIGSAMTHIGGGTQMWDEEDGFFYDVLRTPDGGATRLKVKSMVGLLPLTATTVMWGRARANLPEVAARAKWFVEFRPQLIANMHDPRKPGYRDRLLLAIVSEDRLRRVLSHMLDEKQFLSPYGIRSLSAMHREQPYEFYVGGQRYGVGYLPAESDSGMFGGNSNWRGPIWMPVNALMIRALVNYYAYYGNDFQVEFPTGSGRKMNLYQVAYELTQRLARIFTPDEHGYRPVHGGAKKFREDPLWRDHILFYEYFHGDNGAGIGASHQTGWTGLIAPLLGFFAEVSAEQLLESEAGLLPPEQWLLTQPTPVQPGMR